MTATTTKKAPAAPTFLVPPSKASYQQNRFFFTVCDYDEDEEPVPGTERTYSFPKLQFLSPTLQRRLLAAGAEIGEGNDPTPQQAHMMFELQLEIAEYYVPGFEGLFVDGAQMSSVFTGWQAASGISLGESSASPDS